MILNKKTPKRKYFILLTIISIIVISFLLILFLNKNESINTPIKITKSEEVSRPFTILLVPGHDTNTGGASFKNIYERDLTVDVADNISLLLNKDPKFKIITTRDKQSWNPIFENYFSNNSQAILDFKNKNQADHKILIDSGQKKIVPDSANHSIADKETALKLYGINKWANENNVDLILHLHFNSSGRKNINLPGTYSGFDMFVPEKQRINSIGSRIIAQYIYKELQKSFIPGTKGNNYSSIFEDQSLIALGASDTLTKPSILIEYAYIYEKMLTDETNQKQVLEKMAEQTVLGIKDYLKI